MPANLTDADEVVILEDDEFAALCDQLCELHPDATSIPPALLLTFAKLVLGFARTQAGTTYIDVYDAVIRQPGTIRDDIRDEALYALGIASPRKPYTGTHAQAAIADNDIGALVTGIPDINARVKTDASSLARLILNAQNKTRRTCEANANRAQARMREALRMIDGACAPGSAVENRADYAHTIARSALRA